MREKTKKFVIGIDEVGRGPLAGPVAVCAVKLLNEDHREFLKEIDCSKKMQYNERKRWSVWANKKKKEGIIDFKLAKSGEKMIEKKGINYCINDALKRAISKLNVDIKNTEVLLDGLLKAPVEFDFQKTIIRGDEKEPVISLASIIAKVKRDEFMERKSKIYPQYGFEKNKGYGTLFHRDIIKKHGLSPIHRKTFIHFV